MKNSKYPEWEIIKNGGDAHTPNVWYQMFHKDGIFAIRVHNHKEITGKDEWIATLEVKQLHHYKKEWRPAKNRCSGTVTHCVKEAERRMYYINKNKDKAE